jgi:hypothetical protein
MIGRKREGASERQPHQATTRSNNKKQQHQQKFSNQTHFLPALQFWPD